MPLHTSIPCDVDRNNVFRIKVQQHPDGSYRSPCDGKSWGQSVRTQNRKDGSQVYMRRCNGMWQCVNQACDFLKDPPMGNHAHFFPNENGDKHCDVCDSQAYTCPMFSHKNDQPSPWPPSWNCGHIYWHAFVYFYQTWSHCIYRAGLLPLDISFFL